MRNFMILGTMASALLLGATNVKADEAVHYATASASVANTTLASANLQDWRYRYHNNQWWYWNPGNYWQTYNNGAWNRYGGVGVGVGAGAYVGPRYGNYYGGYRGYPYYSNYRGNPYYGGAYGRGYYGPTYRNYGPAGVAGRAAVRVLR